MPSFRFREQLHANKFYGMRQFVVWQVVSEQFCRCASSKSISRTRKSWTMLSTTMVPRPLQSGTSEPQGQVTDADTRETEVFELTHRGGLDKLVLDNLFKLVEPQYKNLQRTSSLNLVLVAHLMMTSCPKALSESSVAAINFVEAERDPHSFANPPGLSSRAGPLPDYQSRKQPCRLACWPRSNFSRRRQGLLSCSI